MGKMKVGQLILTDQRLVYIKYLWKHWHAQAKDYTNNIDEGLKNEESFQILKGQLIEATMDSTWGTPYLRVRFQTSSGEKAVSFILTAMWNLEGVSPAKGPYKQIAQIIEQYLKPPKETTP